MTTSNLLYDPDPSPNTLITPRLTGNIYLLISGMILTIVITASTLLFMSYNNHIQMGETDVQNTSAIYRENARLVMGSVNSLLEAMTDHMLSSPDAANDDLHSFLTNLTRGVPTLRTLLVIDAQGTVLADSRLDQDALGMSTSDREYFLVHQGIPVELDEIFIDAPVQSRVDGAWSMPFSRGVYDNDGNLVFVVVASIEPRYFHDIFTTVDLRESQQGVMLRDDGTILSSLPYDENLIGQTEPNVPGIQDAPQNSEIYHGAFLNVDNAIVALQDVPNWSLSLAFMIDRNAALQGFYQDVVMVLLVSTVLITAVISTGRYQIRQARALMLQSAVLQRVNQDLRREITDRQQTEQTLNITNRQLNMLLEHLPVLLYTIEKPGQINPEYIGGSLLATIGYDLNAMREDPAFWRTRIHPQDRERVLASRNTTLRSTRSHNHQYRWQCADGSYIWIMDYLRLVKENGHIYLVGFWVDMTEQMRGMEAQRTSEQLKVDLEKEQDLHAMRSRFLSMVTHEFRNPIAALKMSVSNLERYGDRMPADKRDEKFVILYQLLDQLNLLVEDILLTGKLENDQLDIELERADFCAYCTDVVKTFKLTNGAEHNIIYKGAATCQPTLFDTRLMRHVLINVLGNAAKYSKSGTTITFTLERLQQGSQITITDEGIGIPSKALNLMFDLFYRADNTQGVGGMGVGLALTKHIVNLHHGTISVESELGTGTTVTIRLPVT